VRLGRSCRISRLDTDVLLEGTPTFVSSTELTVVMVEEDLMEAGVLRVTVNAGHPSGSLTCAATGWRAIQECFPSSGGAAASMSPNLPGGDLPPIRNGHRLLHAGVVAILG